MKMPIQSIFGRCGSAKTLGHLRWSIFEILNARGGNPNLTARLP
jgi:hypothetical protein